MELELKPAINGIEHWSLFWKHEQQNILNLILETYSLLREVDRNFYFVICENLKSE